MDVSSSPGERDTDIQDVRSPSEKGNMEVNDNILNHSEHPRASKDLFENSPSKKRVLEDDPEKVPEQETSSQCLESPSKQQKLDSQQAEESHFYGIFQNVLDGIAKRYDLSNEVIEKSIETIITSFYYHLGNKFSDVCLSRADNICAYLFRLATLHAGLVRFRCLQAIQNCSILESVLSKTELRVVSLGGGPGNDILGFLSALFEVGQPKDCQLQLSVVDSVDAWKNCVNLVNNLIKNKKEDFGSVSEICRQNEVNISFHNTKLPCNEDDNCYDALKKGDIILISRLISILDWPEKEQIMRNVHQVIKENSLVLFIDAPFYEKMLEYFESLYRSEEEDYYALCETNTRFNKWESGLSKAGIAVLRKIPD